MKLLASIPLRAMGKPAMGKSSRYGGWMDSPRLQKYASWQADFVMLMIATGLREMPLDGLVLHCEFATKRKAWRGTPKRTKPDCDNISKAILDSLWGAHGVYVGTDIDDAQLSDEHIVKVWSDADRISFFHDPAALERIESMGAMVADAWLTIAPDGFLPNIEG